MKKLITALVLCGALLAGCGQQTASDAQVSSLSTLTKANRQHNQTVKTKEAANRQAKSDISSLQADLSSYHQAAKDASEDASEQLAKAKQIPKASTAAPKATPAAQTTNLANQNYAGQQEIVINQDNPGFSKADLATKAGAWEQYSDLDAQGRAVEAQALLNQSLTPTQKREGLTYDPTGWHNRRTAHGWLYNRSHLIGFQLSGENNNERNLITGTMSLNNPLMLAHEMDIAEYLKASSSRYVRYSVKPWYRGNELVARGVQMRAQSIGDNTIHFNVYIFNVEAGYTIDYATGNSTAN
ncbi:DNA/RNA non-specific endonuclease [Lacticaseibacillus jixiensis]|uniref:DNA/RNA non-specific endonuclease n=1 Tax=Lacticaseibacillus jixiensis TaxID=3231926 RepID=UPI0036F2B989